MRFDRVQTKWEARARMAGVRPHPMLVTLVYQAAANLIPQLLLVLALSGGGASLRQAIQGAVLGLGYYPEGLLTGSRMLLVLFLTVLTGLFAAVLGVGYTAYTMHLARRQGGGFQDLLDCFGMAGRILSMCLTLWLFELLWLLPAAMVLVLVTVLFLAAWDGLAAGIILLILLVLYLIYAFWVTLRYAMAWYLFLDDPYGSARGHLRASARLMMGWKWEYLKLELSFFGWLLLSALTMGILGLWVSPYMGTASALFYDQISGRFDSGANALESGTGY